MKNLKILDTFRIDQTPNPLMSYHIQRSFEALHLLNPTISKKQVATIYDSLPGISKTPLKARLEIDPDHISDFIFTSRAIEELNTPYRISFSKIKAPLMNEFSAYKTTDRQYWIDSSNLNVTDDVIKISVDGFIADTSRFNLFILDQNQFYTPSLSSGCLKGCFRQKVLDDQYIMINTQSISVQEKNFKADEVHNKQLYVGNSLRGLLPAELVIE